MTNATAKAAKPAAVNAVDHPPFYKAATIALDAFEANVQDYLAFARQSLESKDPAGIADAGREWFAAAARRNADASRRFFESAFQGVRETGDYMNARASELVS